MHATCSVPAVAPPQLCAPPRCRRWRHRRSSRAAVADSTPPVATTQPQRGDKTTPIDVSSVVVAPAFRATSAFYDAIKEAETRAADAPVRVLFLSEGNTCRSVLAEALFTRLLAERNLSDSFTCESKGTRDYNVGEGPDAATLAVGTSLGLNFLAYHVARSTNFEVDINLFDLMLPVDKFTAADVLRECTVYDTIYPKGGYVDKVRTLAEFNASPGKVTEIDDPLYGSLTPGGPDEVAAVTAAAAVIQACCLGLVDRLGAISQQAQASGQPVRPLLAKSLAGMAPVEWVRPPMLSKPLSRAL